MRNLGLIITIILWLLLGRWMCSCYCESCCTKHAEKVVSEAVTPVPVAKTVDCPDVPICFTKNSCEPHLGTSFNTTRDSLISLIKDGQKLRIIGTYGSTETNDSEFDNLGLCRANSLKASFEKAMDASLIEIGAQLTVGQGAMNNGVSSDRIRFSFVGSEAKPIPTSTLIYFPFNSTDKLDNRDVESYLDSVADRVSKSGERVRLTGHTDNIGSNASNEVLGRRRATVIRDYLVAKGVNSSKISIDSKGETQPVASNDTETGRARNRRTELQII